MSTPILYNKVTPNIKKPVLALTFFILGFTLFSLLIILPYQYGIAVSKKENIFALSSFVILFIIYIGLAYDAYAGFKFPYFIQKYLIDPKLRHDLEDNHPKMMNNAYILEIQPSSKSTYALLLQSADLIEPEWFHVNLNLMFPKLYFFNAITLKDSCLGQEVNIEYLPESKVILSIIASEIEANFNMLDEPFFCAIAQELQQIPSQFLLDFPNIQSVAVERPHHQPHIHQLVCRTAKRTHYIPSTTHGFQQLELALTSKINVEKYQIFKANSALAYQDISI